MISAIVFDFGNVMYSFDLLKFLKRLSGHSDASFEELQGLMKQSTDIVDAYESGKVSSETFFAEIARRCRLNIQHDVFVDAYTDIFTPIPATLELIARLKPSYRLGLLSNTNKWHFDYGIRRTDIFKLFDAVTLSFEVGAMKPDGRTYHDMLAKLAMSADGCVYIDDLKQNVDAAITIGMHGIHYTSHESLVPALHGLGVRW